MKTLSLGNAACSGQNRTAVHLRCQFAFHFLCTLFLILSTSVGLAADSEMTNTIPVTFESFLTNPPVITHAEFEVDQPFPPEVRAAHPDWPSVQTNRWILRADGTNYMLYQPVLGGYMGRFGSIEWRKPRDGPLQLADMKFNSQYAHLQVGSISSLPIRRLLNLGILQMIPNTLVWVEGAEHFTAKCVKDQTEEYKAEDIRTMDVRLKYMNGVPLTATTKDPWGGETEIIYKYDSLFFEGKIPAAFDVMWFHAGSAQSILYSVQIKELQLSRQHIDLNEFDPRIVVLKKNNRGYIVLSNDHPYSVLRGGQMVPTPTAEEAQEQMAHVQAQKQRIGAYSVRNVLILVILVPLTIAAAKYSQQKK